MVVIGLVLACMAAYALAWLPFRGSRLVLAGIVALQVVPVQMALVPLTALFGQGWSLGPIPILPRIVNPSTGTSYLAGTYVPLWVTHLMFALPLMVFLLYGTVARLPRELFDAAKVDGAAHVQIFRRLVLPLATPMLASLAIFEFLWIWNDLIVAITFSTGSPDVAPVTAYLAVLKGGYGQQEHLLTAGAFVAIVIPLRALLRAPALLRQGPARRIGGELILSRWDRLAGRTVVPLDELAPVRRPRVRRVAGGIGRRGPPQRTVARRARRRRGRPAPARSGVPLRRRGGAR